MLTFEWFLKILKFAHLIYWYAMNDYIYTIE